MLQLVINDAKEQWMGNLEGPASNKPVPGEALQKLFEERGCYITLEQSEQLARVLLKAAAAGMLVPLDEARSTGDRGSDLT